MAARVKKEPAARRDQHDVPDALRPAGYDLHRPNLAPQHHPRNTDLPG
jgi:hypothetical protein